MLASTVVALGAAVAAASFADAATTRRDLAVATSDLQFQPPATLPDTGVATVTITDVGNTRPTQLRFEVDTVSRLQSVSVRGIGCSVVHLSNGNDVGSCTVPWWLIPSPGSSRSFRVTVTIASPPGDCSCVPFTVRIFPGGDVNPANNVATSNIAR
jgi:hypothetical protein